MQVNEIEIPFDLHPLQDKVRLALNKFRFVVLVAGRRWGKTTLAIIVLVINALWNRDGLYWYIAPSYRQAKMISWRMLKKIAPPFMVKRVNESELSMTFTNDAVIELKGADNEDSLRGVGLWGMVIDEFASIYNNWSVWNEVLRPTLADRGEKAWCLFIGTPKGKDAFWELYTRGQRQENGWCSFQFKTIDNPFIDAKEIAQAKIEMPERYYRQEFEASFEDFQGLIYVEYGQDCIIEPYYIPDRYPRIGCIDPAVSGKTACIKMAVDEEGVLIIYDEYYEDNVRVSEVVEGIRPYEGIKWFIDPAAAIRNQVKDGKLYSLYDEYHDGGLSPQTAENDVDAGLNRVGEYFKTGRIKIFKTCTNLIWELERYHWSEAKETVNGMTTAKPFKKDDHLCDCLRYLVMSRPRKADISDMTQLNPDSPWGRRMAKIGKPGNVYNR